MRMNEVRETNKQVIRGLFEDCLNTGRLERLSKFVAEDYEDQRGGRGPAALATPIMELLRGFPDLRYTIEDIVAEGDRIAARWTWEGTHRGAFRTLAPTGRRVTNSGMGVFRLRDARVVESWIQTDHLRPSRWARPSELRRG